MAAVVEAVASGQCQGGSIPLFNSHQRHVASTYLALAGNLSRVFISGLIEHPIRHCLYGCGQKSEIKELWSKDVVFPQISVWQKEHFPNAKEVHFESTATAIERAANEQNRTVGAIGAVLAGELYEIPRIETDIQNPYNTTLFACLQSERPSETSFERIYVLGINASPEEKLKLGFLSARYGMRIFWNESTDTDVPSITIFEIDHGEGRGNKSASDPASFLSALTQAMPKFHFLGGSNGTSFGHFAHESARSNPRTS